MPHQSFFVQSINGLCQNSCGKKFAVGVSAQIAVFVKNKTNIRHPDFSKQMVINFSSNSIFIRFILHPVFFVQGIKQTMRFLKLRVKNYKMRPVFSGLFSQIRNKIIHLFLKSLAGTEYNAFHKSLINRESNSRIFAKKLVID